MTDRQSFPGLSLEGSTALVTGGGSGIGLETALTFADLGADVAILDIADGTAEATARRVRDAGRQAHGVRGDVGKEEDVVRAFEETRRALGDVDIAVACAGVIGEYGPVSNTPVEMFDEVLGVNVRGSFLVIREASHHMRRCGHGAIVVLSSADGIQAEHGMLSYCTSKGALLNLARSAALDLARERITVNAICPSVTLTPLLQGRLDTLANGPELLAGWAGRHPLGRVLSPRDIAAAIAFIVSPLATGITGAAIPVDAGIGATWDSYSEPSWLAERRASVPAAGA